MPSHTATNVFSEQAYRTERIQTVLNHNYIINETDLREMSSTKTIEIRYCMPGLRKAIKISFWNY